MEEFGQFVEILKANEREENFTNLLANLIQNMVKPSNERLKLRVVLQLVEMFGFRTLIFNNNPELEENMPKTAGLCTFVQTLKINLNENFHNFATKYREIEYAISFENNENDLTNPRSYALTHLNF